MKKVIISLLMVASCGMMPLILPAQQPVDTITRAVKNYKNIIRYNLSGGIIFGIDRYVVFGYERMINKRQSISVNFGKAALPRIISINTDSFSLTRDLKNKGTNFSIDWRFYLTKENKFAAPHGLYIGPFYSYNGYKRTNEFSFTRSTGNTELATTTTDFKIHTFGAELGYQLVLWKRLALDMVLVGPGISSYTLKAKLDGNLSEKDRTQLREALQQIITQKFPGMNYVLGDKEFNANGVLDTWSMGFRYIIHIGFMF
jgi:hypothetical protein